MQSGSQIHKAGVGKLTALLTDKVIVFLRPVICFQKESWEGLRRTAVSGI